MATRKTSSTSKKKTESDKSGDAAKKKAPRKAAAAPKPKKARKKKQEVEEELEDENRFAPIVTPPKPKPVEPEPVAAQPESQPEPVVAEEPAQASTPVEPAEKKAARKAVSPAEAPGTETGKSQEAARPAEPEKKKPAFLGPRTKVFHHTPAPTRPMHTPPRRRPESRRRHESIAERRAEERKPAGAEKKKIVYNEMMTVKDVADAMQVKVPDVIKKLLGFGAMATINQRIDTDTAAMLADAFGFELEIKSIYEEEAVTEITDSADQLKPRSPVVTVMGHVDHGKTSLLDAIRSTRVAEREAGGITQHIGAYQVPTEKGAVTFLDTPGHEAFTAMRARGADVTDIVILVVAADDSVMPQTIEAMDHARAAKVPIVVAINKVDLPQANVQRVKQELAGQNLLAEDWGGKVQMIEVSAKTKSNIDKLLEAVLLEAELLELKANPDRPARAVVLEAKVDPRRGVAATVLVQAGTMRVGDVVVCGLSSGRIRAMMNDVRKPIKEAGPAVPVEVLGLTQVPEVGDQLAAMTSDRDAREIAERRRELMKEHAHRKVPHTTLEGLHAQMEAGEIQDLNVIVKADVQGSLQALQDSLGRIPAHNLRVKFIHSGVGNINDSDVLLAETSDSIVFGFNVKVEGSAEAEAKRAGVDIRNYSIIYELLADVRAALEGLLKPVEVETIKGRAVVRTVFASSRHGQIAGCMVQEGKLTRGHRARVIRNGDVIAQGPLSGLRRFKDDVKEVDKGYECGVTVEGVRGYQADDIIEDFVIEKQARRLEA